MRQPFSFFLKSDSYYKYRVLSTILFSVNAIFFIALGVNAISHQNKIFFIVAGIVLLLSSAYHYFKHKKGTPTYIVPYAIIIFTWLFFTPYWYLGILSTLLLIAQWRIERNSSIKVNDQLITIDAFIPQQHLWDKINNIILNGGLLTIDFKNNKILQVEPDWNKIQQEANSHSSASDFYLFYEKEFNEFCRLQLAK